MQFRSKSNLTQSWTISPSLKFESFCKSEEQIIPNWSTSTAQTVKDFQIQTLQPFAEPEAYEF